MRGKYSPTVTEAYMKDQNWWDKYAGTQGGWNQYDPEGFDSYGYNKNDTDRAGNQECEYYSDDWYDCTDCSGNFKYDLALDEWGFDGIKPVKRFNKSTS